jgi:hypothetical protein
MTNNEGDLGSPNDDAFMGSKKLRFSIPGLQASPLHCGWSVIGKSDQC